MPSTKEKVLMGLGGAAGASILAWRTMFPWIGYDLELMKSARVMTEMLKDIENGRFFIDIFEEQVVKYPREPMLIFEDRVYTFELMNQQACKVANIAMKWGLKQGSTVAIFFENEPAFIWTFLGLVKLGLGVAFINYHIRSRPLLHSIKTSEAKVLIVGPATELHQAIDEIRDGLDLPIYLSGLRSNEVASGYQSWDDMMMYSHPSEICRHIRDNLTQTSPFIYIYTSGTTGLPKPAILNNAKGVAITKFFVMGGMKHGDIIYTTTPLYHSAAVLALSCVIGTGSTMVLRRKFSAKHYWSDCRRHNVTIAQYIGELCRYLLAQPKNPEDGQHSIKLMVGNGLRIDIWQEFQKRFKIPKIVEFFGATEGAAAFMNVNGRVGAVGRWSPLFQKISPFPVFIVRYDPETEQPYRGKDGYCQECKIGEAGIMISSIPDMYGDSFYKGGKQVNEKKLVRNAFKKGDAYFNFGDLLYKDSDHFLYFKDRVGDTFRWKGENVSTNEVANVLTGLDFVQDANVYGVQVPGQDGRAGMAAILLKDGEEFRQDMLPHIYKHCEHNLPSYARPIFLRLIKEMPLTSTHKQLKVQAVKEGFDPQIISDPLFSLNVPGKTYVPLTVDTLPQVLQSRL